MDAQEMTADELMELAKAKAGEPSPAAPAVTVRGMQLAIDREKLASWKAFGMVEKMEAGEGLASARAAVDFACYVAGIDEAAIVEACGGEDAKTMDVLSFAREIIAACNAKN